MSRNKFNLKDKKTKIIIGSTIIIVLLFFLGIGLGLSSINNTDSKNIANQGQDKTDKKEDSKKEESKKEETSSKEETTSEGTGSSSVTENKTEGNNGTSSESVSSESSSSNSSSSSSSSSSNSGVTNEPSTDGSSSSNSGSSNSGVVSQPSTGGSSSSDSSSSGSTSKPEAHSHSWNPITSTVHHDEVGHWEDVLVQDAWVEKIPVYDEVEVYICNGCGADITSDPDTHAYNALLAGNIKCAGYSSEWKQVQVGANKVNHGAIYDIKYVVDTPAWDETVTTVYQCSCGATK